MNSADAVQWHMVKQAALNKAEEWASMACSKEAKKCRKLHVEWMIERLEQIEDEFFNKSVMMLFGTDKKGVHVTSYGNTPLGMKNVRVSILHSVTSDYPQIETVHA